MMEGNWPNITHSCQTSYKEPRRLSWRLLKGLLGATKIVHFDPIKVPDAHFLRNNTRTWATHLCGSYFAPIETSQEIRSREFVGDMRNKIRKSNGLHSRSQISSKIWSETSSKNQQSDLKRVQRRFGDLQHARQKQNGKKWAGASSGPPWPAPPHRQIDT